MSRDLISTAIQNYFEGERTAMWSILAFSLILVSLVSWLYLSMKDGFSRGFGATVVAFALILSATAFSLLKRDVPHSQALLDSLNTPQAQSVLAEEVKRLEIVIGKYTTFRNIGVALAFLAIGALLITRVSWINGMASGLLLLVVAQQLIDHYSEDRAVHYLRALQDH